MALQIAAIAALVIWVYLVAGRGGFWRMREGELATANPGTAPRVAVVIPARNEADVIGRALGSLAAQDYAGPFQILLVDDHSTDGTAEAARATGAANVTV